MHRQQWCSQRREDSQVQVLSALQQIKYHKYEAFLLFAVPQGMYFHTSELSLARICQRQGCLQYGDKGVYQPLKMALKAADGIFRVVSPFTNSLDKYLHSLESREGTRATCSNGNCVMVSV